MIIGTQISSLEQAYKNCIVRRMPVMMRDAKGHMTQHSYKVIKNLNFGALCKKINQGILFEGFK